MYYSYININVKSHNISQNQRLISQAKPSDVDTRRLHVTDWRTMVGNQSTIWLKRDLNQIDNLVHDLLQTAAVFI